MLQCAGLPLEPGESVSHILDGKAARLAAGQFGLLTRSQAIYIGFTHDSIHSRIVGRRWEELEGCVYRIGGAPQSIEQLTLAAVFASGPGAAASHRSAAAIWRLRGISAKDPEVIVPYGRRGHPGGVRVYRSRTIRKGDVTAFGPIPITSTTRTLLDLAGVLDVEALEDALDDALQRQLTSARRLGGRIDAAGRGVVGVGVLRGLIAVRWGSHLGESRFENRLRRVLLSSGLPSPVPQYVVRDGGGTFIARVDLAYPRAKVAIEADGYAFHSGRRDFERDRVRQNRLINAGWRVLRFTQAQLAKDPQAIVRKVSAAVL